MSAPASSENSQSVNGYDAYFRTHTTDETSHTLTHHLEGALAACGVDENLVREFQLSGDKLGIIARTNSPKEKQNRSKHWPPRVGFCGRPSRTGSLGIRVRRSTRSNRQLLGIPTHPACLEPSEKSQAAIQFSFAK